MKVQIYTIVLCPKDEAPTKENCKTSNVVALTMETAFKYSAVQNPEMRIVSFSYTADAVIPGSLVDFE